VFAKYNKNTFYVAISDADRHPALDYVATIHHGIETGEFSFSPTAGSYLAFFGRIHPDKGVVAAIDAAEKTGIPIRLAGIIQDDQYFKREIVPRLDGDRVRFVGSVRAEDRSSFLGGALALLHLIDFDEPFGLSVVEAMACGTPVIAFDRGSMPELIIDGKTGSLVSDVASAAEAITRVGQLDRQTIRDVAVQRFSSDRMIDAYVGVYQHAIAEYQLRSSCGSAEAATAFGASQG
jgi:glycosyltransferase involved in cell wall biosynthesis